MASSGNINSLFLDIGGVLLTNGWDREARHRAVEAFDLDYTEINDRHHLSFDTYEEGKLSLDRYLDRVIFYEARSFSKEQFKEFMFAQSKPMEDMMNFIRNIKRKYKLKIIAVSNEGRELNEYRIQTFKLAELVDSFISSSFVHFRKPDEDIFRMALDVSQMLPSQVVYIDDRELFVQVASDLGINGIHHLGLNSTKTALEKFGIERE